MVNGDETKTTMDVEKMRHLVKTEGAATNDLGQHVKDLRQGLAAIGNVWGEDDIGSKFYAQYGPSVDKLLSEADKLVKSMDENSRKIRALPGELEKVDEENARRIRNRE